MYSIKIALTNYMYIYYISLSVNSITLNYIDVVDQPLEFQLKVLQFIYWV